MRVSFPEVGRSCRILSILLAADTTSSMLLYPNFLTSAASGWSRALRNASTACLSAASSSWGCRRLASFSVSPANSIISLEPCFNCLSEAQASSLTEPAPRRDSRISLAASSLFSFILLYFLFFISVFSFFYLMSFPTASSDKQSTALPPLLVRLFSIPAVTPILGGSNHGYFSLFAFYVDFWLLVCGKHRKTL